jgi:hypothetical protein
MQLQKASRKKGSIKLKFIKKDIKSKGGLIIASDYLF